MGANLTSTASQFSIPDSMISWIQHHLIRHGRWIFLALLFVIIVAFVFTIGNTPGCAPNRSAYEERTFYGYDLNSRRDMELLSMKVSLSAQLNGQPIRDDQQFQSQLMNRIALLHLADTLQLPAPDQAAIASFIQSKPAFSGPDGAFSRDAYIRFVDNMESNPQVPQGLVVTVLEEDYRISQIGDTVSGPGYVLPSEARAQALRQQTVYDVALASVDFATFEPEMTVEEDALRDYYETNAGRYEIPERIRASYLYFPTATFVRDSETPEDSTLREHFMENREAIVAAHEAAEAATAPEAEGAEDGGEAEDGADADSGVTFTEVRDRVLDDWERDRARRAANEAAQDFAFSLYNDAIEQDSPAFAELLESSPAERLQIEPYAARQVASRELPEALLQAAFDLGGQRYYSDPYPVDGGFAVLLYEGRIEPEIPPFEDVEQQVRTDYERDRKRELFNAEGERLREALQEALASGEDFAETAASLGLAAETVEPFAAAEAPQDLPPAVLRQAQGMSEGDLSPMLTVGGKGTFVYLQEKTKPEITDEDENYVQARTFLTRYSSFLSANGLVNELIARGMPEESAP